MNPLVVVCNFPQAWHADPSRVERLEKIIKDVLVKRIFMLRPESVAFSFPVDPSVLSNDVPIYVIVKYLSVGVRCEGDEVARNLLASDIWQAIYDYFRVWRGKDDDRLFVAVEPFESGFCPRPKKD